jgi:hypothetical protein
LTHQTKADSLIKKFLHQENEQEKRFKLNYSRITCSVIGEYHYAALKFLSRGKKLKQQSAKS